MSIEKSVIKQQVVHDIGCQLDDALEVARREELKCIGAVEALGVAKKLVQGLASYVDKDLEEGKLAELLEKAAGEPLVFANALKVYLGRAAHTVEGVMLKADNSRMVANGKVIALDTAVKMTKKVFDTEGAKAEALRTHIIGVEDAAPRPGGVVGARPAASLKTLRAVEEAPPAAKSKRGRGKKKTNGAAHT